MGRGQIGLPGFGPRAVVQPRSDPGVGQPSSHMISRVESRELDVDAFRDALMAIYAELDAEVARRAPVCQLSGRCCRFAEYDHTLFLSSAELGVLLADAPEPSRPLDEGETCPWQDDRGRCTARGA